MFECLPFRVDDADGSSRRGQSYKFAQGRRIKGFLTFLVSKHSSGPTMDWDEFFETPQGFKVAKLKDLYDALLKYATDRIRQGEWRLEFADPTNSAEDLRKLISKCFVRVHQRLQFLTLYFRCLRARPLSG